MQIRKQTKGKYVARNINKEFQEQLTLGQRVADRVASFGGSWPFIFIFAFVLFVWMLYQSIIAHNKSFDPYPFILLNLVLSCLAAIQAPVILMSQNREAQKDRLQSSHDFEVNLKAEKEIEHIQEELDAIKEQSHKILKDMEETRVLISKIKN
jgi:uncharacterized membrane protein